MTVSASPRYCLSCGARLARDNVDASCRPCQRAAHDSSRCPPEVPAEFWQVDQMRDALSERHIGHVVRAYRTHPYHGRKRIAQELAAHWLGVGQTQLSRIEGGSPVQDLDRLIQWAKILRIPQDLLWFDLPKNGEDVNRRQLLTVGGGTAAGMLSGVFALGKLDGTPDEPECAQWLAWELWQRNETSLPARELPRAVARVLKALPPAGGVVLRDRDGNYSFAHQSFVDFFVAQRVFDGIASGASDLLATAQTSHETDQVVRRFVMHQDSSVGTLTKWMRNGATPILRVNSAGILAKLGDPNIADDVITKLKRDADTRHLYLTAVANRVLALPWEAASLFAAGGADLGLASTDLSEDRTAELAVRLSHEMRHSDDSAARWCCVMLISRMRQHAPATVISALQEALRDEPCRENLRAIGNTLANADPFKT